MGEVGGEGTPGFGAGEGPPGRRAAGGEADTRPFGGEYAPRRGGVDVEGAEVGGDAVVPCLGENALRVDVRFEDAAGRDVERGGGGEELPDGVDGCGGRTGVARRIARPGEGRLEVGAESGDPAGGVDGVDDRWFGVFAREERGRDAREGPCAGGGEGHGRIITPSGRNARGVAFVR